MPLQRTTSTPPFRPEDALPPSAGHAAEQAPVDNKHATDAQDEAATALGLSDESSAAPTSEHPSDALRPMENSAPSSEERPYLPPAADDEASPRSARGLKAAKLEGQHENDDTTDAQDEAAATPDLPDESSAAPTSEDGTPEQLPPDALRSMEEDLRTVLQQLPGSAAELRDASEEQRRVWAHAWVKTKLYAAELDVATGRKDRVDHLFAQAFVGAKAPIFTAEAARHDVRLQDLAGGQPAPVTPARPTPAGAEEPNPGQGGGGGTHFSLFGGFSNLFASMGRRMGFGGGRPGDSRVVPALAVASDTPAMALPASPVEPTWDSVQNLGRDASAAIAAYRRSPVGEAWQAIEAREIENGWDRGEYLKRLKANPEAFADDPLRGQLERGLDNEMTQTAKVALAKSLEAYQQQLSSAVESAKEGMPDEVVAQLDQLQKDMAGMPVGEGPLQKVQDEIKKIAERIREMIESMLNTIKGPR